MTQIMLMGLMLASFGSVYPWMLADKVDHMFLPQTYWGGFLLYGLAVMIYGDDPALGCSMGFITGLLVFISARWCVIISGEDLITPRMHIKVNDVLSAEGDSLIKVRTTQGCFYLSFLHNIKKFIKVTGCT